MDTRIFHRSGAKRTTTDKPSALWNLFVTIGTLSILVILIALGLVVVFAGAGAIWALLSMAFDFGFEIFH